MASEEYKESEAAKLVKKLMDEEGFEFGEAVREAIRQTKNFESKADGGSVGIEILFEKKKNGGRVGFNMGGAQFTSGGNISPGTDKRGNIRDDNPFTGGGGGGDGPKGPPVIINPTPTKDKSTELLTFDEYTGKPMTYADVAAANKFLNFVKTQGGYKMGEDPEADALYDAYQTATGRDTFMQDATVDSVTNMRTTDIDGDTKSFFDQTSTITDNPTGRMSKSLMLQTPTSFTQRFTTPTGIMENDVPQKFGAPQSLSVDPYSNNIIGSDLRAEVGKQDIQASKMKGFKNMDYDTYKTIMDMKGGTKITPFEFEGLKEGTITEPGTFTAADGGRVGLFMGGDPLTGQALAIYNSMKAYGEEDQAIADKLQSLGYYDPNASTTPPPGVPRTQVNQGRGNDQDTTYVDRQDYSFNKKNYVPGGQLEINPAAFGMSFEKASKPQGIINAALEMPGRTLTSFASPTTGGNITGPAEEGFMSQVVDIDPAGRTREQLRQQYDSYNRFFGAPSNYAAARTPGKAGQVLGTIAGAAAGIPFVGPAIDILSKMGGGDKGLQSKYTVDNVGFGNTGARDEFGLATFDRKDGLFGLTGNTTRDYADRMKERLGELDDFFGSRIEGFDINNLDAATLNEMSKINSFYTKQIQAYKQRLAVEDINKNTQDAIKAQEEAKKKEEAAFQAQLNETQRQQRMSDLQRIERAYREETGGRGGSYATGESGIQRDSAGREVGYNDPFDPGGGEKDGGFIDGYNRRKYSEGGLATMFTRRR